MSLAAPPLDGRSAEQVRAQLEALLAQYVPDLTLPDQGAGAALNGIFARFAELIIERLNRTPDKNRLAFFDLIGASLSPPQPARVPLSFALAPGASDALVPARTPVAAPAGLGREQPLLFETERDLAVTSARLTRLMSWDGSADLSADLSAMLDAANTSASPLFRGATPNEHVCYLGFDRLFSLPRLTDVYIDDFRLAVDLRPCPPRLVQWQTWDGSSATTITLVDQGAGPCDPSDNLTHNSDNGLGFIWLTDTVPLPSVARSTLSGMTSRWLRCRLDTPLGPATPDPSGTVRTSLPTILQMGVKASNAGPASLPDASFQNEFSLDVSKDFYPFGGDNNSYGEPRPKVGATWYLASREALSKSGREIEIRLGASDRSVPRLPAGNQMRFKWEYWTAQGWTEIGTSSPGSTGTPANGHKFFDGSEAFTFVDSRNQGQIRDSAAVDITLVEQPLPTVVNGQQNFWIRVRVIGGATLNIAPSLSYANLVYFYGDAILYEQPDALIRFDGLQYKPLDPSNYAPFAAADDNGRSLYFGFELPAQQATFAQRPLSLYFDFELPRYGDPADNPAAATPVILAWSYWSRQGWQKLLVRDETGALAASGMIEFLPPADFVPTALFEQQPRYWLKLAWMAGDYRYLPRLRRVLQNVVMGVQAATISNEILGSSTAQPQQQFSAARKPVLSGVQLEVREPELPSAAERAALMADEGSGAIKPLADGGGAWVRWHEVSDFHASGPRDRHFVLDHLSGRLRFGDGSNGLIPPRGAGNVRLASYRSGHGAGGNTEAGTITQLKTSVPFVASVVNPIAAAGGVGAENMDALLERAPRTLRHRDRAVTVEDYEDLARLASPEVARSRCVPLLDLRDPTPLPMAGRLSLIIVPVSAALKPTPATQLVEHVQQYLDARRLQGVEVIVLGAEYVSVDVAVVIGLRDLESAREVDLAVRAALSAYLHPLTGGVNGRGWDFGRHPHRSDLYALLEALPGVDHVRALSIAETVDRAGVGQTDRFLVCSGHHSVDLYYGD